MILPRATLYTLGRLFIAYIISLIVALIFGIYCVFEKDVAKIWLPIIDVLQTVPLLAFFSIAIEIIIGVLGGKNIAYEIASIFLTFTAMFWNLFYAVYDSINSTPQQLQSFTHVFRIPFLYALKYVYIPLSIPNLVSNSIISWANGWFFVVLNEYVFYEAKMPPNKGIGNFLHYCYVEGNIQNMIIVILWVCVIIIITHLFIWDKLLLMSGKFKISAISENPIVKSPSTKRSVS
ncbi:MAG: ABC transporter permease subunit, partial [Planctomycetota bacterium]